MSVATSYAKALYGAAKDKKASSSDLDQLENQMDDFSEMLNTSSDLNRALLGPIVTAKDKTAIINELGKKAAYSSLFVQFLSMLATKGRLPVFHKIRESFTSVRLEAEGGVSGRLVSAEPLNDADVEGLAKAFGKKLGKRVAFIVSTDPSLLAGMRVTVGGVTYDGTLRSQLQQLRDQVVSGVSAD
jgi:F-type H+-transporting ATPase subunit delta